MLDYIQEVPSLLEKRVNDREWTKPLRDAFQAQQATSLHIIASGSSNHAAWCVKAYMEHYIHVSIQISFPFSFYAYEDIDPQAFYLFISQSGHSTNTLMALHKVQEQGIPVHLLSALSFPKANDGIHHYDLGIGKEEVPFVCKGFSSTLFYLLQFTSQLANISVSNYNLASLYQKQIEKASIFFTAHKEELLTLKRIHICGYGANLFTAKEAALKFCETLQIATTAYEIEEFLHGGYLELEKHHAVFLLQAHGQGNMRVIQLAKYLPTLCNHVYIEEPEFEIEEWSSPLIHIAFFQTLVYRINEAKGNATPMMKDCYITFEKQLKTKTVSYYDEEEI